MKSRESNSMFAMALGFLLLVFSNGWTQYAGWKYSGSFFINTTPDGANLPSAASEIDFPVLLRLNKDFFDFGQAKPDGSDIRFATTGGIALNYQIETWDALPGTATIWIRIPKILGNQRQEIKVYWGNPVAASESRGKQVYSSSNGYASVMHLTNPSQEEVGTHTPVDQGTESVSGIVGMARSFSGSNGILGGNKISQFPQGGATHTTSFWVKPYAINKDIMGWGVVQQKGQVKLLLSSSGSIMVDMWWGIWNVNGKGSLKINEWNLLHFVYELGNSKLYINGELDVENKNLTNPLNIPSESNYWLGGWNGQYGFKGELDEVRISHGTRSINWVRLEYENQKTFNSLTGIIVPVGSSFNAMATTSEVLEGKSVDLKGEAGGAHKVYWMEVINGKEKILTVDQLNIAYSSIRVRGDSSVTLRFKAIYPNEIKTKDITLKIKESIPDPIFTFNPPSNWNGRDPLIIKPLISNLANLLGAGMPALKYAWKLEGPAIVKNINMDTLTLIRGLGNGILKITLSLSNGDGMVSVSKEILVNLPTGESEWVARIPELNEKPVENQFYARDKNNVCKVYYQGSLNTNPDSVFLRLYRGSNLEQIQYQKLNSGRYGFTANLTAGLFKYRLEFGTKSASSETILSSAKNLLCGDAYLFEGQSNTVAGAFGDIPTNVVDSNEWIWTHSGSWKLARHRGDGGIGYWGFEMSRMIVENHNMPVCILNGAVGGTQIGDHQRNEANPTDGNTIYGRILSKVKSANLTHGIRAALWHQGEADQAYGGKDGGLAWLEYEDNFKEMTTSWKKDMPNIQYYYMFQIWPGACSSIGLDADNALREVQRTMPNWYSNLTAMSTLGVRPGNSCHYSAAGYLRIAELITPLVARDNYGKRPSTPITAPNLKRAYFNNTLRNQITLEFDQEVVWNATLNKHFYLDGIEGKVSTGKSSGNLIILDLIENSKASKITYLDSRKNWTEADWDNIIWGKNGIAAFTFWNVPIFQDSNTPIKFPNEPAFARQSPKVFLNARGSNWNLRFQLNEKEELKVEVVNLMGQKLFYRHALAHQILNNELSFEIKSPGLHYIRVFIDGKVALSQKLIGRLEI